MIRGVDTPKQPTLVKDFSAVGIERELLVQKQIVCPAFLERSTQLLKPQAGGRTHVEWLPSMLGTTRINSRS